MSLLTATTFPPYFCSVCGASLVHQQGIEWPRYGILHGGSREMVCHFVLMDLHTMSYEDMVARVQDACEAYHEIERAKALLQLKQELGVA